MSWNPRLKSSQNPQRFTSPPTERDSLTQIQMQLTHKIHKLPAQRLKHRARKIQSHLQEHDFLQSILGKSEA